MRLTARERILIMGGAGLLGALLFFQLTVYPAYKRSQDLDRLIPQKEQDLRELRRLTKEYDSLKELRTALIQKVPVRERNLPPLSKLEGLIERSGIRQNIRSIKPSPGAAGAAEAMTVEILLEKADLRQLTRFLYEAQSFPGGFRIIRLGIKPRYTTPKYLDLSLQMVFYQS